jgi:hypothetical protein
VTVFRNDPHFWRRFVTALLTATEQDRLWWWDTPDEPALRTFFPDGIVRLVLPAEGAWPPEVVVEGAWDETLGTLRPEAPEDLALVERLYRLAERTKRDSEEDIGQVAAGKRLLQLKEIIRDIDRELGTTGNGALAGRAVGQKR